MQQQLVVLNDLNEATQVALPRLQANMASTPSNEAIHQCRVPTCGGGSEVIVLNCASSKLPVATDGNGSILLKYY